MTRKSFEAPYRRYPPRQPGSSAAGLQAPLAMAWKPAASGTKVLYFGSSKALVRAFRGSSGLGGCGLG